MKLPKTMLSDMFNIYVENFNGASELKSGNQCQVRTWIYNEWVDPVTNCTRVKIYPIIPIEGGWSYEEFGY